MRRWNDHPHRTRGALLGCRCYAGSLWFGVVQLMIDQATAAVKSLTGAKTCEFFKLPQTRPEIGYVLSLTWEISTSWDNDIMKSPQKFSEKFLEFWQEATRLLCHPRILELEGLKMSLQREISGLENKIKDLERYKTAYELKR